MTADKNALSLGAILYDGFELLDLYGPLEMFGIKTLTKIRFINI
jgi:hypothetical protein